MARLRTFVAVGLDESLRDRLVALQEKLAATGSQVKWVEPENLHVTLLFLGEVGDVELLTVCRAVEASAAGVEPFVLEAVGVGCFPNPRRPRTLWVGVGEGRQELVDLHDSLEEALSRLGCYRREGREFTPHVTLGRVQGDSAAPGLGPALAKQAAWHGGDQPVREVLVMSSELRPEGPRYTVLSRARLRGESARE
jgi:RNA 2',3'-cyclic 3'-phosphodiesterase